MQPSSAPWKLGVGASSSRLTEQLLKVKGCSSPLTSSCMPRLLGTQPRVRHLQAPDIYFLIKRAWSDDTYPTAGFPAIISCAASPRHTRPVKTLYYPLRPPYTPSFTHCQLHLLIFLPTETVKGAFVETSEGFPNESLFGCP